MEEICWAEGTQQCFLFIAVCFIKKQKIDWLLIFSLLLIRNLRVKVSTKIALRLLEWTKLFILKMKTWNLWNKLTSRHWNVVFINKISFFYWSNKWCLAYYWALLKCSSFMFYSYQIVKIYYTLYSFKSKPIFD
jgi:hypothetical protein